MTDSITPPQELILKWHSFAPHEHDYEGYVLVPPGHLDHIATQAARWGADQELEGCVEWLDRNSPVIGGFHLRIDRRPKPPSLKERALHELNDVYNRDKIEDSTYKTIRRALEALDD